MQPWMAGLIWGVVIVIMVLVAVTAVRRSKALCVEAQSLGLEFTQRDEEFEQSLEGTLPIFSKGQPQCSFVMKGREEVADYFIFNYPYRRKTYGGRSDRETAGVVVRFCLSEGDFDQILKGKEVSDSEWRVEFGGPWLACARAGRSSELRLSAENLPKIKSDNLYRSLV